MKRSITLIDAGADKTGVMRILRENFGLSLEEAKDIVSRTPCTVEFTKEYSEDFLGDVEYELTQAGAIVDLGEDENTEEPLKEDEDTSKNQFFNKEYPDTKDFDFARAEQAKTDSTSSMSRQELLDYCKDVLELESQIYAYNRMESEYDEVLRYVGVPRNYRYSVNPQGVPSTYAVNEEGLNYYSIASGHNGWRQELFRTVEKPEWLQTDEYRKIDRIRPRTRAAGRNILLFLWNLLMLSILAAILIFTISRAGFWGLFWMVYPIVIIVSFWYLGRVRISGRFPIDNREFEAKEARKRAYFQECTENETPRIAESEQALRYHIENERTVSVINPADQVRSLLNRLYEKNIIYPKYRNFVAVAQIYEYLASGRCNRLEGSDGAYNLYESELRHNTITKRLDEIARQLERHHCSMPSVCGVIETTNHLLDGVFSAFGRIETNTALEAYNNQCVAGNTKLEDKYKL